MTSLFIFVWYGIRYVSIQYSSSQKNLDQSESTKRSRRKDSLIGLLKKRLTKDGNTIFESDDYVELKTSLQEMIQGVLSIAGKIARDIMIPRVDIVAVDIDTDLKTLLKHVCNAGHSRVPVYEENIDNIVGIIYVKELLLLLIDGSRKKFQVKKYMRDPFFVPETMPLDELLLEFKMRKLHMAVVVDEYGGIGGVVTLEDILEEIVGDIHDEFETDELPEIEKTGADIYEVDSRVSIEDFNEVLGTSISSEDFDTIGGYVLDLFGKIPKKGEQIENGGLTFKIKSIKGTIINRIVVTVARAR